MSLRSLIVRRCLQSCIRATGLRVVKLPLVVDARQHVDPPVRLDAGYLVVDRRAFPLDPVLRAPQRHSAAHTTGYATLSGALRAICAERIGVAGRAAIPGPKRAVELRREGPLAGGAGRQRAGGGADARAARGLAARRPLPGVSHGVGPCSSASEQLPGRNPDCATR